MRTLIIFPVFLLVLGFTECYEPVTKTGLPKGIKTIAVPAFQFEPRGARYRIESRFSEAVIRELLRRGRGLKVQSSREGADAVIEGNIRDFNFTGVLLDTQGRARVYEVTIVVAVSLIDTKENKVIYDNQNLIFRDSFEFSEDPRSFFNEEDPAVERIARSFAESLVSSIINGIGVRKEK
ncbi:MAG: LPS assembly lipoprotein LptE [Pyrinomonadaceae bacterium]|nr:LPS assembly lipoprotein LptE [Pyrinomonadaceae bacterium]MCX7640540.1 LPS assembly lipoprotein LptE [Pyrinomonadaceae bacterium]MDW8303879.1 LptE family protein [Acidobacteriota bacterium]